VGRYVSCCGDEGYYSGQESEEFQLLNPETPNLCPELVLRLQPTRVIHKIIYYELIKI